MRAPTRWLQVAWRTLGLLLAFIPAAGCQSLGYYAHVTWGQLRLLGDRQPVDRVLRDLASSPEAPDASAARLAERLDHSQKVLDFAERELALPVGRRYRTYVELDRPYVVWNVVAAPEFSLEPHQWCYPIAGCAPYRGFFSAAAAERAAQRLADRGMDVHIGGVAAYSTLGWFADPLLSSFIGWPEADVAELLIHELAHGAVWVPDDVPFNESFATFVGLRGAAQWQARADRGHTGEPVTEPVRRDDWRRLVSLFTLTRARLDEVYRSPAEPAQRRAAKQAVIAATRKCYVAGRAILGGGRYDALLAGLNNAVLASIATYEDLVPAFARLFDSAGGSWTEFQASVREIARLPTAERLAVLERLRDDALEDAVEDAADDHYAEEIECQALERHVLDGELSSAVDHEVRRGRDG